MNDMFYTKQDRIYQGFKESAESAIINGLETDPAVINKHGGFLIAFRHLPEVTSPLNQTSKAINTIIPSILFDETNLHTTISGFKMANNRIIDPSNSNTTETLTLLTSSVHEAVTRYDNSQSIKIELSEYLFNKNTVIVRGNPNNSLLVLAQDIIDNASKHDIHLNFPWGGHITISRFITNGSMRQAIDLKQLLANSTPPQVSKPFAIDIGYTQIQNNSFTFTVFERVLL